MSSGSESVVQRRFESASCGDLTPGAATIGDWHARLLIEDDSAVAQSIELMLKSESFNVYTTTSEKKASISENSTITTLSCSTSICLTCRLRRLSSFGVEIKTPILILSGLAGIETRSRVSALAPTTT